MLLFPCSSLLFPLGNQRKGRYSVLPGRCAGVSGPDEAVGEGSALTAWVLPALPVPGRDELGTTARGSAQVYRRGHPLPFPSCPVRCSREETPEELSKQPPQFVFAHMLTAAFYPAQIWSGHAPFLRNDPSFPMPPDPAPKAF